MQLGYVGLGKMGKNMVLRLLEHKVQVVAWNRSPEPREEVKEAGALAVESIPALVKALDAPRMVWLMLPSGEPTDQIMDELIPHLSRGDLVIDGSNAFYKDTLRRHTKLTEKGIHFIDVAVSGGPSGARNGACLMVGGEHDDVARVRTLIEIIAAPKAHAHLGPVGAGHFAKMVHNGIEYGMMQAIAEGAAVLKSSSFSYDLSQVFQLYNHRSVIESRLVGWAEEALRENPELEGVSSVISHTGEGAWTVDTARELGVEVPVITTSLQVRIDSIKTRENFGNKVVSALRGKFGGHSIMKPES